MAFSLIKHAVVVHACVDINVHISKSFKIYHTPVFTCCVKHTVQPLILEHLGRR
jgi:hypothetical protein